MGWARRPLQVDQTQQVVERGPVVHVAPPQWSRTWRGITPISIAIACRSRSDRMYPRPSSNDCGANPNSRSTASSAHLDQPPVVRLLQDGRRNASGDVVGGDGLEAVGPAARDGHQGQHLHQRRQRVEELIALPEQDRRPKDGVRHPAPDDLLLAQPLAASVWEPRVVPRP